MYMYTVGDQFLASASRDRMVHIFQCPPSQMDYQHAQSLPDHSAAVTAVKFAPSKDSSGLQLLSSGADKSVIFHSLERVSDCFTNLCVILAESRVDPLALVLVCFYITPSP